MSTPVKPLLIRTLAGIAIIAFLFSGIVAVQLTMIYSRMNSVDPLNNPAIEGLIKRLEDSPKDEELRLAIRDLDQHSRAAFFHSQQRLTAGRIMLVVGLAVVAASIAGLYLLRRKAPMPEPCAGMGENEFTEARYGRLLLVIIAIVCIGGAGGLAVLLPDGMDPNLGIAEDQPPVENDIPVPPPVDPNAPLPSAEELQAQWVSFRGWQGRAVCSDRNPVTDCDVKTGKNILWKTAIPSTGYSSPIVWKDKLFITAGTDTKRELLCYSTDTGIQMWTCDVPAVEEAPEVTEDTGYAAATAVTDGLRVYAVFATGDLVCVSMDGREVWSMNLGLPANHYGHSASLIMHGRLLIVQFYHSEESILFAFDGPTGDTVWEADRDPDISWSSPVLMSMDGKDLLLVCSSSDILAYDPATGKELWKNDCLGDEVGPSPAWHGTTVFAAQANVALTAIDAATGKSLWDTANVDLPDTASPLATGKYLYLSSPGLYISCINPADGELKWEQQIDDMCYSSPVLVGENIYQFDNQGNLYVFKDADTFTLVAKSAFSEAIVATPAFVGDRMYVRGTKHLFCIAKKDSGE